VQHFADIRHAPFFGKVPVEVLRKGHQGDGMGASESCAKPVTVKRLRTTTAAVSG
jgi:hypothetical protein